MRHRWSLLIALVGVGVAMMTNPTLADVVLRHQDLVPSLNMGPVQAEGVEGPRGAAVLYSRLVETGNRFNPSSAGGPTPADNNRVAFDDVPINNALLAGNTSVAITRVTVGIRRLAAAPATDITIHWATMTTGAVLPDTELDLPSFPIGTVSLPVNGAAAVTTLVTIGDGVSPLFVAPLNTTLIAGFSTMMIGVNMSNPDVNNGWRITSGTAPNVQTAFWMHDPFMTGQATPEGRFQFAAPTLSSFSIEIEGTPVPEPTALALLGLGAATVLGRRRR